jgi:hypothetical protein
MQFAYYPVTKAEVPQIKPTATNGAELGF